ncbi:MAG: ABC transporter ATP-binding protein [Oscillospiraceae bacterium]|nr:ABC transporter ATP-binding protein [Oscillospiraceae bacterium]
MLKTLLSCLREYRRESILTPVFVTCEVLLECLIPLLMAKLIDDMDGTTLRPVLIYGAVLTILALVSLWFGVLSSRSAAKASAGFAKNLRKDLFFRIQDFSFADIDLFTTPSLITRMTTDVTNVQNAYQMILRIAVRTPLMIVFSLVMSLAVSVRMSLIFLCVLPVLALFLFGISWKTFPLFRNIFKEYDALNTSVEENVEGIRVVKAFVREDYETKNFQNASEQVRRDYTHAERIMALNSPAMTFCVFLVILLVAFLGGRLIITSLGTDLSTGELSTLTSYGMQILVAVMMLSTVFSTASMAAEAGHRITEVLNYKSTLTSPENGATEVKDGSIRFDHVSFRYRKDSERTALQDINLNIPSGTTVGIIGGTGSSKSTLIQLIPRLYDVSEGAVYVGGRDVCEYDLTVLRDAVAVVLQKNVVFSGTVRENLRWGSESAGDEELENACRMAQADEFIRQMPDGYDTVIDQDGANISGGQKQRICLARALLKKPKILILDDSTSAVDTRTDALIRNALKTEIPDTTKIIIAQRISSVQDADTILVMDSGKIVEQGNHKTLLKRKGIYYEVWQSQTKKEADAE